MDFMLSYSGLRVMNYDSTLIGWVAQNMPPSGIKIGVNDLKYCLGEQARNTLMNTFGWSFGADVLDCSGYLPNCASLNTPVNGAVNVSVDADLSWSAIAEAKGYRLNFGTSSGASDILNQVDVGNVTTYDLAALQPNTAYYLTITPYNDFGSSTGCAEESFMTGEMVGVEDAANIDGFSIYPNPVSDVLQLSFTLQKAKLIEISLSNALGEVVSCEKNHHVAGQTNVYIDTSNLKEGVYWLVTKMDGRGRGRKFVVVR